MPEEDNDRAGIYIPVPRTFFAVLGTALVALGGGGALTIAPTINQSAIEQCFSSAEHARNTAQTALELSRDALAVAAQHGDELNSIRSNYFPAVDARREALAIAKELERINRELERRR